MTNRRRPVRIVWAEAAPLERYLAWSDWHFYLSVAASIDAFWAAREDGDE